MAKDHYYQSSEGTDNLFVDFKDELEVLDAIKQLATSLERNKVENADNKFRLSVYGGSFRKLR